MNYRHAFHAGNFADVAKHSCLALILRHLLGKPAPFRVVDTHAGIGRYDLEGDEATRTGEAAGGIGRMAEPFEPAVEALLAPYRAVLAATRERHGPAAYPGSPAILREMLRPCDRAILIEKHPDDAALLRDRFNRAGTTKVLAGDGWSLLPALIPPRERRGLVLVDPPYEEPGELARALDRLDAAMSRWPTGTYALWYPLKDGSGAAATLARRRSGRPALRLEVTIDDPSERSRLNGSGLVVWNPPWTLAADAGLLLPALATRLSRVGRGGAIVTAL